MLPRKRKPPRVVPTAEAIVFGEALRRLRETRGIRKADVLRQMEQVDPVAGVSISAYCHWEAGRRVVTPRQLLGLLRALGSVQPLLDSEVMTLVQQAAQADDLYLGAFLGLQGAAPGAVPESAAHRRAHWERWAENQRQYPPRAKLWR